VRRSEILHSSLVSWANKPYSRRWTQSVGYFGNLEQKVSGKMHLVVLIHGLGGLASGLEMFNATFNQTFLTFAPTANHGKTYDGINAGAERILRQVEQEIAKHPQVDKLSIIAHSLGGVYARQLIHLAAEKNSPLARLEYMNFVTLASPHVGSREHARIYSDTITNIVTPLLYGRTGRELMLIDSPNEAMLLKMVSEKHLLALERFRQLLIYSNIFNDHAVDYCTSAMHPTNPYKGHDNIDGVVNADLYDADEIDETAIHDCFAYIRAALNTLHWRKYACYFSDKAHSQIVRDNTVIRHVLKMMITE
jgi:Putative serine esterase (DUF676)